MGSKASKRNILTPFAQQIVELIESVGDGNQRTFATRVGCSQSAISRIINGQQKPGRDLIERIAKLDGVDGQALLASLDEPLPYDITDDYLIPIATSLLRSVPKPHQLSPSTLAVSRTIFRPTIYAVPARACEPAFSDPSERLRADDLIVMESSIEDLPQDVQMLHGKLCAVDRAVWQSGLRNRLLAKHAKSASSITVSRCSSIRLSTRVSLADISQAGRSRSTPTVI